MEDQFKGKVVLVTGGTGSIGSKLVEHILTFNPRQVRVLSRDEGRQYELLERLRYPENLRLLIGDIRERERLEYAFKGVDIILHAAAMKQVPLCEYNPFEAVKTNILGSQNVIDAAIKNNVKKVIAISTDKAVYPANVMGASKLMMEKLFINANWTGGKSTTKFSCVRFGNVTWARGSVLPTWKQQIEKEGSINVTNPDMTRFMMSIDQAVRLVLKAVDLIQIGEVFVLKMPSVAIGDLATMFIKKYHPNSAVKINNTGGRAGDRMHEELVDDNDRSGFIFENNEMYIFVPNFLELTGFMYELPSYLGFAQISELGIVSSDKHIDPEKINNII